MGRRKHKPRMYRLERSVKVGYGEVKTAKKRRKKGTGALATFAYVFLGFFILAMVVLMGVLLFLRTLRPGLGGGEIRIGMDGDEVTLEWPQSARWDLCRLYRYDERRGGYALYGEYRTEPAVLSRVEQGRELRLRFQAVRTVSLLGLSIDLTGDQETLVLNAEGVGRPVLSETAGESGTYLISWPVSPAEEYQVFLSDGDGRWEYYTETDGGSIELDFDDEGLSGRQLPLQLAVLARQEIGDTVYYSPLSQWIDVPLGESAAGGISENEASQENTAPGGGVEEGPGLTWESVGICSYVLHWRETEKAFYEIQRWSDNQREWETEQVFERSPEMSYETGRLPSAALVRYRLVMYDTEAQRRSGVYPAEPVEALIQTDVSALYCTVWPIQPLDLTEEISGGRLLEVPAGAALCVLGEEEDHFLVRYQDTYGYVDSRYCLINLPEYLGNCCTYDIASSYRSLFRVHGYEIPYITNAVVQGYEGVSLENGEFLVPYLYPCAKKLRSAVSQAAEDGYRFRIYDAFRPNEATRVLYDSMERLMDYPVPEKLEDPLWPEAEQGGARDIYGGLRPEAVALFDTLQPEELEAGSWSEAAVQAMRSLDAGAVLALRNMDQPAFDAFSTLPAEVLAGSGLFVSAADAAAGQMPADVTGTLTAALGAEVLQQWNGLSLEQMTALKALSQEELIAVRQYLSENAVSYGTLMTDNGRYHLGSFLAAVTSAHNRGIALDLTLEKMDTGEELAMQTEMHDLSWYAATGQNNENAQLLSRYMKGAGFHDLSSEWWHFQDDATRSEINLDAYLSKGVEVTGWKKDDRGWKYRLEDGTYYQGTTAEIDGKSYTFDQEGYCPLDG